MSEYRLLAEFRKLFDGNKYEHRRSNLGDFVALHLYEDLAAVDRSLKYVARIKARARVVNIANKRTGIKARRGDGTFGELIPNETAEVIPGYDVARGPVATIEIGVEVKILAKAMIKQIDRVTGDLLKQVDHFKYRSKDCEPICIAILGVNHASVTTGYEGDRSYRTDGKRYPHPIQEAESAVRRLEQKVEPNYDHFQLLRYRAENEPPYPFEWVNYGQTVQEYGALLARVSRNYERRF